MMNLALPGFEECAAKGADIVLTPDDVAADVVRHFRPTGRMLDPCRGNGAFWKHMPGAEWCEVREGRDFFGWRDPVDWIVSNPPYSIFSEFLRHSFTVADNIVYLIPVNKAFNSDRMMREIWEWGGIETVYVVGPGGALGFPIGFCIGAVHFRRGYRGGMRVEFRIPNAQISGGTPSAESDCSQGGCIHTKPGWDDDPVLGPLIREAYSDPANKGVTGDAGGGVP